MKLHEIKDWYKVKLRNSKWSCEYLTYSLKDDCFYSNYGDEKYIHITHLIDDDTWEVYKEPKETLKTKQEYFIKELNDKIADLYIGVENIENAITRFREKL